MLLQDYGILNYSAGGPAPTGDTKFKFQITTVGPSTSITIPHLNNI